jgi:drug/metabolite transporter (DMT)-like permease
VITILLGFVAALGWGAPDVMVARAIRRIGPFPLVACSLIFGGLLALPLAFVVDWPHLPTRALWLAPLIGILTVVGFQAGFTGFAHGSVSVVAPIIACEGGVAAALLIVAGERPGALVLAGLPLAVIGVALVSLGPGGGRAGVVPAVLAAAIWGVVLAISAPLADDVGAVQAFLLVRASAVAVLVPAALITRAAPKARPEWRTVVVFGAADAMAFLAFILAAHRGPASVAGVFAAQFGTVGALVAVLFYGERLLRHQVVGIAAVAIAVGVIAAGSG